MAYQLNFTEITFGVQSGGGFSGDPTRLPGSTRLTYFQRPRQVIRRKCPAGTKSIERPIQQVTGFTWEGEFYPGLAWTTILSNWLQSSATSGTGTAYTPDDSAPVEFLLECQAETIPGGGPAELYAFNNCVLTSLSIQWQSTSVPVFRAEWLARSLGFPEELTAPVVSEETPGSTVGAPSLTNAYLRLGASSWGVEPPTPYLADSQAFQIILTRDIQPVQFNRLGNPTRYGWSGGLDVAGRIQTVFDPSAGGVPLNLIQGSQDGLLRIEMPTVLDGAEGFYFDINQAHMSILNLPILSDSWASRVVEFVNVKNASGHSVTFYDGQ